MLRLAHQGRDGRPDLDPLRVRFGRENARIGRAVGCNLACPVLVPVKAIDTHGVECFQITLAHSRERQAVQPRVVGNEAHHATSRALGDPSLRHPKEPHIKIVEPLSIRSLHPSHNSVRLAQFALLVNRHACESVIRRVSEHHQDRRLQLHTRRLVALVLEFRERQRLRGSGLPPAQRVGQKDACSLASVLGQRRTEIFQCQPYLQLCHDKRRGHDLEPEHPLRGRPLQPLPGQPITIPGPGVGIDPPQHLGKERAGSAARIQHVNVIRCQPLGDSKIVL